MATSISSDHLLLENIKGGIDISGKVHSDASTTVETEAGMKPF